MTRRVVFCLVLLSAACGDDRTPAQPSPPPAGEVPGAALTAEIALRVDDTAGREAVASASEVAVEASAGNATGAVAWSIDFGDGTTGTGATTRHTFAAPGSYTIRAQARDTAGRTASTSRAVTVTAINGTLVSAAFNARTGKLEVRSFVVSGQDGATVRGTYRSSGEPDRPFTGTLSTPRRLRITMSGTEAAEGTLPDQVSADGGVWPLLMHGDSVDGVRLEFKRAAGSPAEPAPDAVSTVRSPLVSVAIVDLTPVTFDGSSSKGADLSYFFEFGDGDHGTGNRLVHRPGGREGNLTARLTVVDRFGRSDAEDASYWSMALDDSRFPVWAQLVGRDCADPAGNISVRFASRDGLRYQGSISYGCGTTVGPFSATLSGDDLIALSAPTLGIQLSGQFVADTNSGRVTMRLMQSGGEYSGKLWELKQR